VSEGARLLLAAAVAAVIALFVTPIALWVARRTGFLDKPVGYKAHREATPYLGGAAVVLAMSLTVAMLGTGTSHYWPLLVGTLALSTLGTVDDRLNLSPWLRLAIEALVAWFIWDRGFGWSLFGSEAANLLLTVFWVTGIVNAFNLMDNLDGAAASVAAVVAAGIATFAIRGDTLGLAVIAVSLLGALVGFLRYNLAGPARIFLGDGGSMAIGFLIAGSLMVVPLHASGGWFNLIPATIAVGLPVFDTALVVRSRRRRGAPVLSGARDHTTHRLLAHLGSARAVAFALAVGQAVLCAVAIGTTQFSRPALMAVALIGLLLVTMAITVVDDPRWISLSEDG
jgi:UDP-GlcNAc:undecaprenyl-phosphate/decaprenyl-phosphate GlcNAc-1-phosphate transferase